MRESWKNIGRFLLVIAAIVLVSFASAEQEDIKVRSVKVHINSTHGDPFLDEKDVVNLVYSRLDTLLGKPIGSLRLSDVESLVKAEVSVKNAEVYVQKQGDVHLNIELKKVIVRLKPDTNPGFYIDEEGAVMPWVTKYTPRVTTITGHLSKYNRFLKDSLIDENLQHHSKLIHDAYEFAEYVGSNNFWKSLIGQIYIDEKGDAILIPIIGEQEFVLGELTDYETKLNKVKQFYDEIAPKLGWGKYRIVNVKFDKQIVCK